MPPFSLSLGFRVQGLGFRVFSLTALVLLKSYVCTCSSLILTSKHGAAKASAASEGGSPAKASEW